jgi:hypothetical protein
MYWPVRKEAGLQIIEAWFAEQFYASRRMRTKQVCLKISAWIAWSQTYRMIVTTVSPHLSSFVSTFKESVVIFYYKISETFANLRNQCCGSGMRDPVPYWPLDPGWVKNKIGSGMNNLDHISESLQPIFWVKILKFFDADPGSRSRDGKNSDPGWKKFGSGINIPDPRHCMKWT